MVAPGELKVLLNAVPSTAQLRQSMEHIDEQAERSTQASHETIVETNLEEAQGCDASHTSEQCVATEFHHVERSGQRAEMKANVAGTMTAAAQRYTVRWVECAELAVGAGGCQDIHGTSDGDAGFWR
jgi:hypothetical protein